MKKIYFIQPLLTSYRIPLFIDLAKSWDLSIIYSPVEGQKGFGNHEIQESTNVKLKSVPTSHLFGHRYGMYQSGIIGYLRDAPPDAVIMFCMLRYLSFWTTMFYCKIKSIPFFPHGHGLTHERKSSLLNKISYKLVMASAKKYICYTDSVAESLLNQGYSRDKIGVVENSLINESPVSPENKSGEELGILFIGRLRPGNQVSLLIEAVSCLRELQRKDITLHIIGDGIEENTLVNEASQYPWVQFYGSVYDPKKVAKISRNCFIGCYPGNAGLSIVHMMSLSLPPITHNDFVSHNGPEPSYIKHKINGLLFDKKEPENSLLKNMEFLLDNPEKTREMQKIAYETYKDLVHPSYADRFISVIDASL